MQSNMTGAKVSFKVKGQRLEGVIVGEYMGSCFLNVDGSISGNKLQFSEAVCVTFYTIKVDEPISLFCSIAAMEVNILEYDTPHTV